MSRYLKLLAIIPILYSFHTFAAPNADQVARGDRFGGEEGGGNRSEVNQHREQFNREDQNMRRPNNYNNMRAYERGFQRGNEGYGGYGGYYNQPVYTAPQQPDMFDPNSLYPTPGSNE